MARLSNIAYTQFWNCLRLEKKLVRIAYEVTVNNCHFEINLSFSNQVTCLVSHD
jgi:hypothetical protein